MGFEHVESDLWSFLVSRLEQEEAARHRRFGTPRYGRKSRATNVTLLVPLLAWPLELQSWMVRCE